MTDHGAGGGSQITKFSSRRESLASLGDENTDKKRHGKGCKNMGKKINWDTCLFSQFASDHVSRMKLVPLSI